MPIERREEEPPRVDCEEKWSWSDRHGWVIPLRTNPFPGITQDLRDFQEQLDCSQAGSRSNSLRAPNTHFQQTGCSPRLAAQVPRTMLRYVHPDLREPVKSLRAAGLQMTRKVCDGPDRSSTISQQRWLWALTPVSCSCRSRAPVSGSPLAGCVGVRALAYYYVVHGIASLCQVPEY